MTEEIYERYRSQLQAHCRRLLGSKEDAEDAVQETFLRAWRFRDTRRADTSVKNWLYRIATNVCLDGLDRRKRRRRTAELVEANVTAAADHPTAIVEASERVMEPEPAEELTERETVELAYTAAVKHLPPRQQSVLILREMMGRSAQETADLLGSSVASVNSAGQRARQTMRERLSEHRLEWSEGTQPTRAQRERVRRFIEATEQGDAEALAA